MRFDSSFWRKCRTGFRWCRITVLLAALAVVCAFVWFDRVGVPDFVKNRLVAALRTRGVELQFSRLRLRLWRGFIADDVHFGETQKSGGPTLTLQQVRLELNFRALLHRRLQVNGLELRQGKLLWPLTSTNALTLDRIQTELRFQTNDVWTLDNFQADFSGMKVFLSGDIAHAPELRNWKIFRRAQTGMPTAPAPSAQNRLAKFLDELNRIHFSGAPEISVNVTGDARDFHSFAVRLSANAPAAQTPWFSARNLRLAANLTAPADAPTNFDSSLAWWTNAFPFRLAWQARLTQLRSKKLDAEIIACAGVWQAPELTVSRWHAELGGGEWRAQGKLNAVTRELIFTNSADFDFHALAGWLPEKARATLAKFSWRQPPSLQIAGALILPAWTNSPLAWRETAQAGLRLNGDLALQKSSAFSVKLDSARARFFYSNQIWKLPDLAVARANTRLELSGEENDVTKNFNCHIHGAFEPELLRPLLPEHAARGLDHFTLTQPLHLDADICGNGRDADSLGVTGNLALTNFAVRGQPVDSLFGKFSYTNRVLKFSDPRLSRAGGAQTMMADKIVLDFNTLRVYFTNGFSMADPLAVARAIGPKTGELMEPYQFLQPPTVFVDGCAPMRDIQKPDDMTDADLRFDIVGGAPFRWRKVNLQQVKGLIHWLGATLILTNMTADAYGGQAGGNAVFDFLAPHEGADYEFNLNVTNANLHSAASDLSTPTNHLEGVLSGKIVVTRADTRDWHSWNGFGSASLRNGLIWDIPVFGIVSPALNLISPGLGNSRATEAAGRFIITNGVVFSDSLEIRSTMMRLDYVGTSDLQGNLNARVTAQLLRDIPLVGPLVTTVLWPVSKIFEYQVTGTLKDPKSEPIYFIPKILLLPLHPIRGLEEMLPGDTNAPPGS